MDIPVQRADFYLGAPSVAEYLGTTNDGHPDALDVWTTFQSLTEKMYGEDDYREAVAKLVDVTEWPHKHDSSNGTPWAYCWMPPGLVLDRMRPGVLVVHNYGRKMAEIVSNLFEVRAGSRADAPTMRSGVLFINQRSRKAKP